MAKQKKKLSPEQRAAKKKRREEYMTIFINGKQKQINPRQFSTLLAVLYHLTGETKYKEPLAKYLEGDSLLSCGGYFPASDHWLLNQPPRTQKQK